MVFCHSRVFLNEAWGHVGTFSPSIFPNCPSPFSERRVWENPPSKNHEKKTLDLTVLLDSKVIVSEGVLPLQTHTRTHTDINIRGKDHSGISISFSVNVNSQSS